MLQDGLDVRGLRALLAAVQAGTLDGAAQRLHVTPSAVSQRLRALEAATGRVLLVRSRPVRPTPSGEALLRLARQVELLVADATTALGESDDALPALPVAVSADALATWVLPALVPLGPHARVQVHRADESRTAELLRDGRVVAAITTRADPVPGCVARRLGAMRYRPMAAPALAARHGLRRDLAAGLRTAPVVAFDPDDALQAGYLEARAPGAAPPVHLIPATAEFARAIELGLGWGMLPDAQSVPAETAGALECFDPAGATDVVLHWQQWRLRTPTLDALAAAVDAAAGAALRPG